jgi:hypothetical protein
VVKFLRRSRDDDADLYRGLDTDLVEELRAAEAKGQEAAAAVVLRKIGILQGKEKKIRLLENLRRFSDPWVCTMLLQLLTDPREELREAAARQLAEREDCPMEKLHARLSCPPWYVKSTILRILGRRKNPQSVRPIKAVLNDSNADVKCSAAQALGSIGGQEARVCLVYLAKDHNAYVRAAAVEALEKICDFKFI